MRLHPKVSEEEAYAWLKEQAERTAPDAQPEELDSALKPVAEAMAAISSMALPDDLEPMFP